MRYAKAGRSVVLIMPGAHFEHLTRTGIAVGYAVRSKKMGGVT